MRDLLRARIERALREMVREQRTIADYDGEDEGFSQYVAETDWDWQFLPLVFNSGYIRALLDLAKNFGLRLDLDLAEEARNHMNENFEIGER